MELFKPLLMALTRIGLIAVSLLEVASAAGQAPRSSTPFKTGSGLGRRWAGREAGAAIKSLFH